MKLTKLFVLGEYPFCRGANHARVRQSTFEFLRNLIYLPAPRAMQRKTHVVTLVHGTGATGARWTRHGSALCRLLREQFGEQVVIRRSAWSGRNTIGARSEGAQRLSSRLYRQLVQYPHARHFIVGHSHGGTVAMFALRDRLLAESISGTACLATPFFHVRRRLVTYNTNSIGVLIALVFLAIWSLWITPLLPAWFRSPFVALVTQAAVIIPIALSVGRLLRTWYRRSEKIRAKCQLPDLSSDRLLILRADGDEASSGLGAAALVNGGLGQLWARSGRIATRLVDRYETSSQPFSSLLVSAVVKIVALSIAVAIGYMISPIVGTLMTALVPFFIILHVYPLGWIAGMVLHALTGLAGILLLPIWSVALWPFGPELILVSPFIESFAEVVPPGQWKINHFALPEPVPDEPLTHIIALRHSNLYNNPDALEALVQWIV